MVASALCLSACRWLFPTHFTDQDRRQIASRLKEVIEGAGGSQTWVKGAGSRIFATVSARSPFEVLVEETAFDAVMSAIQKESKRQGLEIQSKARWSPDRRRSIEVRILRRREEACRWRLREVRQLRRAAIVIDDLGQDVETARQFSELSHPLTFSILPLLPHSIEIAKNAQQVGREVMLHLPMEPEPGSPVAAGAGAIKVGMSSEDVARTVREDLASVPHAVGVNNHMGSRATTDPRLMAAVMEVLNRRHLYFVDSRTTAESVALDVARRFEVPAFFRSVFLDDTKTTAYSLGQLRELRRLAEQRGAALAIGHPYPTTLAALAEFLPDLEKDDIELVPVSQLVHLPEIARLSPPTRPAP